ncbi:YHS domain protein [Marivita sp. S6314]|uniref:YHS domain-containing (seleno)protein n=1 Tax=Marivita sp. S6314 TaxID=2926406 RepID=UPI001FF69ADC|nr:YHS domain-containing (seleno)protein [Marivita sp. S6314]MCK0151887.1 YHS domain protein [Marivita sp. S6314]
MHRRSFVKLTLATPALLLARPAFAAEPEIYQEAGIAIDGSDPVGYFTQNGPVAGSPDRSVQYKGATWRFADQSSADAFQANPTAFAPAFGGYCAFAASRGYLAPTTPEAWTIYEDKLYLNANLRARELWLEDIPGNIAKGEANWPGILG